MAKSLFSQFLQEGGMSPGRGKPGHLLGILPTAQTGATMYLWILVAPDFKGGYDTYDSAIVAAETAEDARAIHPHYSEDFLGVRIGVVDGKFWDLDDDDDPTEEGAWFCGQSTWALRPDEVQATCIGSASQGIPAGIVLTSYNAG